MRRVLDFSICRALANQGFGWNAQTLVDQATEESCVYQNLDRCRNQIERECRLVVRVEITVDAHYRRGVINRWAYREPTRK